MSINNLPYQAAIPVFKDGGERWTIGWNVFKDGIKIYYQSFFKLGNAPGNGRLKSTGKFFGVSSAVELTATGTTTVTAKVPAYTWLTCSATPVLTKFDLTILKGQINPNPANLTPQIAKTTRFTNDTTETVNYSPTVSFTYTQAQKTTITDTHTFQADLTLQYKSETEWMAVQKTTFSVTLKLSYGYEHSTSTEDSWEQAYQILENPSFSVEPGKTKHLSILLYQDLDAKAEVVMDFRLSGSINGERCNGVYLSQLVATRPGGEVLEKGADHVVYRQRGTVQARIVSDTEIVVSSAPGVEATLAAATKLPKI